jgi:hypothetical protein
MRVGIITAPRKHNGYDYLIDTIVSMTTRAPNLQVHVFIDRHSIELDLEARVDAAVHASGALATVAFHVQPYFVQLWAEGRPAQYYGTPNFVRQLTSLSLDTPHPYCCVFEDDVKFANDWERRAVAMAKKADEIFPDGYIFSLHHFYKLDEDFFSLGRTKRLVGEPDMLLRWKDPLKFYAGQGMLIPTKTVHQMVRLYEQMWNVPPEEFLTTWVMDIGVGHMAQALKIPILSCNPCLIQHTGDVSMVIPGREPLINQHFRED